MTTLVAPRSTAPGSPGPPEPPARPADREAQRLTGRPYLSHSQLSTFRSCPRKFAFMYTEQAPLDFQAASLLFGGAMHSAFEFWFRARLEGLSLANAQGDLLHAFLDKWQFERQRVGPEVPVRFSKGDDMGTITALAQRVIAAFLASPVSRPNGQIVGIEEQFHVVLAPELPSITARVDLVTQSAEALHVVDLKTSRSRWTPERAAEGADQLLLYGRTVRQMAQGVGLPVKLHFAVLTKGKKPVVQVLDVPADEGRLAAVRDHVAQVWAAVRAGHGEVIQGDADADAAGADDGAGNFRGRERGQGYYANPSPLNCAICAYKSRCPAYVSGDARGDGESGTDTTSTSDLPTPPTDDGIPI